MLVQLSEVQFVGEIKGTGGLTSNTSPGRAPGFMWSVHTEGKFPQKCAEENTAVNEIFHVCSEATPDLGVCDYSQALLPAKKSQIFSSKNDSNRSP